MTDTLFSLLHFRLQKELNISSTGFSEQGSAIPGQASGKCMKSLTERIVYEDNHILVLNKLPSEIVQGDKTGDEPLSESIKAFIKNRDAKPGNVFCGEIGRAS